MQSNYIPICSLRGQAMHNTPQVPAWHPGRVNATCPGIQISFIGAYSTYVTHEATATISNSKTKKKSRMASFVWTRSDCKPAL